jgi:hypothetical protein
MAYNLASPKGITDFFRKGAEASTLTGLIYEILDDRIHSEERDDVEFLFMRYEDSEGGVQFILATTMHRTEESLNRELTPFSHRDVPDQLESMVEEDENDEATLSHFGSGAKFWTPKIAPQSFSILFTKKKVEKFITDKSKYNYLHDVPIRDILADLKRGKYEHKDLHFTSQVQRIRVFFDDAAYKGTPLADFVGKSSYNTFYCFESPHEDNEEFYNKIAFDAMMKDFAEKYAKEVRLQKLRIFSSWDMANPVPLPDANLLHLGPESHVHTFQVDVMLGEKSGTTRHNRFRIHTPRGHVYANRIKNGTRKGAQRDIISHVEQADWIASWKADYSYTVSLLTQEAIDSMDSGCQQEYSAGVYVILEDTLVDTKPKLVTQAMEALGRAMPSGWRYRNVLRVFSKRVKTTGLEVEAVKYKTKVRQGGYLDQDCRDIMSWAKGYFGKIKETSPLGDPSSYTPTKCEEAVKWILEKKKRNDKAVVEASVNGRKFERKLDVTLRDLELVDDIDFKMLSGDAEISEKFKLDGQGIDILVYTDEIESLENRRIWIPVQSKSQEKVTVADFLKFNRSLDALKQKYPGDIIMPFFVNEKVEGVPKPCIIPMKKHDTTYIYAPDLGEICSKIETAFDTRYGMFF